MHATIDAPLSRHETVSADGTRITYYVIGAGPRVWLMPPAMGAPLISMKYLLERFARDYTIVTWDQRGFYGSGAPRDPDALRVADHVADLEAVVQAEKLVRFVLGGWSMSVQISLEYYTRRPEAVRALLLINGPYERALSNLVPLPGVERLAVLALRAGARAGRFANLLSRRLLGAPGATAFLHRVGLLAENPEFFAEVLTEFARLDWSRYFTMMWQLHEHSAAAMLASIRVPTLITAGTHDLLMPVKVAERMHRLIAGSELYVVPRATHYIVAEFPDLLGARIAEFLARVDA